MQRDRDSSKVLTIFRGGGVTPDWPAQLEEAQRQTTVCIAGRTRTRIRYGREGAGWADSTDPCHDCAAISGELHVPGCDMERCPACRGQAISCGCASEELE